MTRAESTIIAEIQAAKTLAEMDALRKKLAHQQEFTPDVYQAMQARVDFLAAQGGITPEMWWRH